MPPDHRSNGFPYVQPDRHDELADGVPKESQVEPGAERRPDGTLVQGASTIPSMGGKAHKGRTNLSHRIEAPTLTPKSVSRARTLRRALSGEIAATVGNGHCGIASSLFIKFASQKTAAAEEAFQVGDFETHRKLSESARMDILYAREHAAKEAEARAKTRGPVDVLAAFRLPAPKERAT